MVTPGKRRKILAKYGGRCAYCGIPLTEETMTIDHFVPQEQLKKNSKYKGGDNLLPCCKPCNLIKRAKNVRTLRMIFRKMVNSFLKRAGHKELLAREFKFLFEDDEYLDKLPRERKDALERKEKKREKTERNNKIKEKLKDNSNEELLNEICRLKSNIENLRKTNQRNRRRVRAQKKKIAKRQNVQANSKKQSPKKQNSKSKPDNKRKG